MPNYLTGGGVAAILVYLILQQLLPFLSKVKGVSNGNGGGSGNGGMQPTEKAVLLEMNRTVGELTGTVKALTETVAQLAIRLDNRMAQLERRGR